MHFGTSLRWINGYLITQSKDVINTHLYLYVHNPYNND